ncbi:MAG: hypothetical protein IJE44_00640 [Clostridia bacterium]|nr:hypothetical protein [Clostridia bacterium]
MKIKDIISVVIFAILVGAISLSCFLKKDDEYSESERRPLAQMTEVSAQTIFSGEFMKNFEEYSADQFPKRDVFRGIKAVFVNNVLNQMDNNGLYFKNGHISKIEYPENEKMMSHSAEIFNKIYDKYIDGKDMKIYLSIIPDKNYFFGKDYGYLSIDYDKFTDYFKKEMPYAKYIDVAPLLDIDDYYKTDSHWKQEEITDVSEYILKEMGTVIKTDYKVNEIEKPFYGVYKGQSALSVKGDTVKYLTNPALDSAIVNYYDTGAPKTGEMYNMEKAEGKDSYEMFLSGSTPLVTIEHPENKNGKELIIFRDSFGSSLAPLLSLGYEKTTVVDIRYVGSDFLGNLIDFGSQDVLFIYSAVMLNNSSGLR